MPQKEKLLKLEGFVTEALPNGQYMVDLKHPYADKYIEIRCYMNGKMRMNKIKILTGDKVKIELPSSGHLENAIGRIVFRIT